MTVSETVVSSVVTTSVCSAAVISDSDTDAVAEAVCVSDIAVVAEVVSESVNEVSGSEDRTADSVVLAVISNSETDEIVVSAVVITVCWDCVEQADNAAINTPKKIEITRFFILFNVLQSILTVKTAFADIKCVKFIAGY